MHHEACSLCAVMMGLCRHKLSAKVHLFTGRESLEENKPTYIILVVFLDSGFYG